MWCVHTGRSPGSRIILGVTFPAWRPVVCQPFVFAYSGGSAGDLHPSSLFTLVGTGGRFCEALINTSGPDLLSRSQMRKTVSGVFVQKLRELFGGERMAKEEALGLPALVLP